MAITNPTSLASRLRGKKISSVKRRLECTLTMNDMEMMKAPLMGHGVCDYTGLPFSGNSKSLYYPTLERIDHLKGYVRGNVCVVTFLANSAKDRYIDNNHDLSRADKEVQDVVAILKERLTPERLEQLKVKYLPNKCTPKAEPYKMPLNLDILKNEEDNMETKNNVENNPNVEEKITAVASENPMVKENIVSLEIQTLPEKKEDVPQPSKTPELPVDVIVAQNYAPFCKAMAAAGFEVLLTYAQFKAVYTTKVCHFTRRDLEEKDKYVFVLDPKKPIQKDNIRVTYPAYAEAMTKLMEVSGQSVTGIALQLEKYKAL